MLPFAQKAVEVIREKAEDFADGVRCSREASLAQNLCLQLMYAVSMLAQAYETLGDFKKSGFTRSSFKFDLRCALNVVAVHS